MQKYHAIVLYSATEKVHSAKKTKGRPKRHVKLYSLVFHSPVKSIIETLSWETSLGILKLKSTVHWYSIVVQTPTTRARSKKVENRIIKEFGLEKIPRKEVPLTLVIR